MHIELQSTSDHFRLVLITRLNGFQSKHAGTAGIRNSGVPRLPSTPTGKCRNAVGTFPGSTDCI